MARDGKEQTFCLRSLDRLGFCKLFIRKWLVFESFLYFKALFTRSLLIFRVKRGTIPVFVLCMKVFYAHFCVGAVDHEIQKGERYFGVALNLLLGHFLLYILPSFLLSSGERRGRVCSMHSQDSGNEELFRTGVGQPR